ncbi:MAG: di-trans,poly-cis-decaprenylcistransferase [Clostridiales bacterium]|nr:di-trans,poly-cis-decaprenylcistransferase [Clostridiales bacterium]
MDKTKKIPHHVGIIMDGNGRWANQRGKKRSYGHNAGSANVDRIVTHAFNSGVHALTLYAFSCENWARPKEEVDELMRLLEAYFKKFMKKVIKNKVRLNVIGDVSVLTPSLQKIIAEDVEKSKIYTDHVLNVAVNYGGRQEIVYAVKKLLADGKEVTMEGISENLYTAFCGEPDLIIRTAGELRTSNFLVYQGAYSELYFTDVLWPDFDEAELDKALDSYAGRIRRYGGLVK